MADTNRDSNDRTEPAQSAEPTTEAGKALYDMGPAFVSGMTFTQLGEHLAAIEQEAVSPWRVALDQMLRWKCREATDGLCVVHGHRQLQPAEICAWEVALRLLGRRSTERARHAME